MTTYQNLFPEKLLSDLELAFSKASSKALPIDIIGSQSPVILASFLSSPHFLELQKRPQLVLVADDASAAAVEDALYFFNPSLRVHLLPGFDVSPYSGLYPNPKTIASRIRWLYRAQYSLGGDVFIAPASALLQRTLPREFLDKHTRTFKVGDELIPEYIKALADIGYLHSPRTEDVGQISVKGGIVDIFSPAHDLPVRIELFGDSIESLRFFDPETQRTVDVADDLVILPAREILFHEKASEFLLKNLNEKYRTGSFAKEFKESLYENIMFKKYFHGIDFLIPYFYESSDFPLNFFNSKICLYHLDVLEILRQQDSFLAELRKDFQSAAAETISPPPEQIFSPLVCLTPPAGSTEIRLNKLSLDLPDEENLTPPRIHVHASNVLFKPGLGSEHLEDLSQKLRLFSSQGRRVIISTRTSSQAERIKILLENGGFGFHLHDESFFNFSDIAEASADFFHIIPRALPENLSFEDDGFVFLREEDFFGTREVKKSRSNKSASAAARSIILSDLKIGDSVTHAEFGVGIYEGLKLMSVGGIDSEFLQIKYQDDDKLYLPVYRINLIRKYSGVAALDKLGGTTWAKTKIKVRSHLRDIASELLTLYAKRSQVTRPPFHPPDTDFKTFEGQFAYDETEDQLRAIDTILEDLQKEGPMDRLVCGDVGFGKTEVAMRAAFKCVQEQRQAAVLVPTTILSFQHFDSFKKRFKNWPIQIEMLSRFTSASDAKKIVANLKAGKVDIVIGTHRLLSKDIQFKNLGLLVVDEEHKFGVTHKEKIKKIKSTVDTLAMSATPIPRTLNMSLVGIRDLSLINTAPQDRLPIRTFVCKYDESIIKKAIEAEVHRGGQVFFLHNRVQTIQEFTRQIQELLPGVRVQFAHGQMEEDFLEKTMVAFFKQEFDVLVCTTIIESGMDIPKANTILINRADTLGLSQLYQLRGRVGRSNERAYCYLLIPRSGSIDPTAQERLKVLQENTDLGSGLKIAHHDLELRGAGNILGEEQAGHANAVGYELYLELLEQALKEARGEDIQKDELEPEINLRIPALIPHDYIPDIRTRIGFYNALSQIESPEDMDRFEENLNDQFGKVPEQTMNLMGIMLLKKYCKDLAIRDLSAGTKAISLAFADFTPLKSDMMIELVTGNPKKYSITPDSRLIIQMSEISWPKIYSELISLKELV